MADDDAYKAKYPGKRIIEVEYEYTDPEDIWTEDEQWQECCQAVPNADPCVEVGKTEPWSRRTDEELEEMVKPQEIFNRYKAIYGDKLIGWEYEFTGPKGNCGEKETEWEGEVGCCDWPWPFIGPGGNLGIAWDETYWFSARNAAHPYSWSTKGKGLSIKGYDDTAELRTDNCFCDPGLVEVTDVCGVTAIGVVSHIDGTWTEADATVPFTSDYGWTQDGVLDESGAEGARVTINGFNNDRTIWSRQSYGNAYGNDMDAIHTEILAEPSYTSSALVIPKLKEGYEDHPNGGAIFCRDVSENPKIPWDYHCYYATTHLQSTQEWEYDFCEYNELLPDRENSGTTVGDNDQVTVFWIDGFPPFDVFVDGVEAYVNYQRTETQRTTNGRGVTIYTKDTCGWIYVEVFDKCGQSVRLDVRGDDGNWVVIYTNLWGGVNGSSENSGQTMLVQPLEGGCPTEFYMGDNWRPNVYASSAYDVYNGGFWVHTRYAQSGGLGCADDDTCCWEDGGSGCAYDDGWGGECYGRIKNFCNAHRRECTREQHDDPDDPLYRACCYGRTENPHAHIENSSCMTSGYTAAGFDGCDPPGYLGHLPDNPNPGESCGPTEGDEIHYSAEVIQYPAPAKGGFGAHFYDWCGTTYDHWYHDLIINSVRPSGYTLNEWQC